MSVGRNERCPCGSGRKFKHCCGRDARASGAPLSEADFEMAADELTRLSMSTRFAGTFAVAYDRFFGEAEENEDIAGDSGSADATLHEDLFSDWFWFDYLLDDDASTLASCLLAERRWALTPGARRVVELLSAAPLRLLEIESVDPDGRLWVVDRLEPDFLRSIEPSDMGREAAPGRGLLARVIDEDGVLRFGGTSCALSTGEARAIASVMTRECRPRLIALGATVSRAAQRMFEAMLMVRLVIGIDDLYREADEARLIQP